MSSLTDKPEGGAPKAEETAAPAASVEPSAAEPAAPAAAAEGGDAKPAKGAGDETAPEEEATAIFKPLVSLEEVDVKSGEETEETLFKMRGKLYRYTETLLDKGSGKKQWIERGIGDIKLLQ